MARSTYFNEDENIENYILMAVVINKPHVAIFPLKTVHCFSSLTYDSWNRFHITGIGFTIHHSPLA